MTSDQEKPKDSKVTDSGQSPTGLDHVGDEDASQLPEEDMAIKLPIEEGDFNAQPQ